MFVDDLVDLKKQFFSKNAMNNSLDKLINLLEHGTC